MLLNIGPVPKNNRVDYEDTGEVLFLDIIYSNPDSHSVPDGGSNADVYQPP